MLPLLSSCSQIPQLPSLTFPSREWTNPSVCGVDQTLVYVLTARQTPLSTLSLLTLLIHLTILYVGTVTIPSL